ncbi:MAG: exodeoxyribonuclease VII small subunit [Firmicutes bacterium]|nr:exodeoxyribonuclease VII small subunit [Bacillota bacterium]
MEDRRVHQEEIAFEEAVARLEKVVTELEKGELTLEEALAAFQEGINLLRICIAKLNVFEEQIEILLSDYYSDVPSWLEERIRGES